MAETKFIDAAPLIAEFDKSIQWLEDNVTKLSLQYFSNSMASAQTARKMLFDAPTADVRPVVLCRECKYSDKHPKAGASPLYCTHLDGGRELDDFCSFGERGEAG